MTCAVCRSTGRHQEVASPVIVGRLAGNGVPEYASMLAGEPTRKGSARARLLRAALAAAEPAESAEITHKN